jgi:DNA-binding MarR family transcriptional regulator
MADHNEGPKGASPFLLFEVFTEIGIIEQLSRALLEARLPDGIIAPHFGVLNHLMRGQDGQTPLKLARAFQTPKTSMTHTLKVLEQRGLIELRSNPEDGRSKQAWITDAGRGLIGATIQDLAGHYGKLAQGLDMQALAQIKPVLTDLRAYLDDQRDPKTENR